jgi:hypothetical protein
VIRPDDWAPSDPLERASTKAWTHWRQLNPNFPRPEIYGSDRQWILHYAWLMRDYGSTARITAVAASVMKRSRGFFPKASELQAEFAALFGPPSEPVATGVHTQALRWSGREEDPCPVCGATCGYVSVRSNRSDYWAVIAPDCRCCGHVGITGPSLHLRGLVARAEDDPHALADLQRHASQRQYSEAKATGRSLADVVLGKDAA